MPSLRDIGQLMATTMQGIRPAVRPPGGSIQGLGAVASGQPLGPGGRPMGGPGLGAQITGRPAPGVPAPGVATMSAEESGGGFLPQPGLPQSSIPPLPGGPRAPQDMGTGWIAPPPRQPNPGGPMGMPGKGGRRGIW